MEYVTSDKDELRAYQMRIMALSDLTSGLNHAREEGIQEGALKIASNMKKRGVPIDQIAEYTGLSVEDLARL
jgi:predicted transposase/invertase (TIGR01784 family)